MRQANPQLRGSDSNKWRNMAHSHGPACKLTLQVDLCRGESRYNVETRLLVLRTCGMSHCLQGGVTGCAAVACMHPPCINAYVHAGVHPVFMQFPRQAARCLAFQTIYIRPVKQSGSQKAHLDEDAGQCAGCLRAEQKQQ
eukprot:364795-Chlamydomonas_euryale.AAC.19